MRHLIFMTMSAVLLSCGKPEEPKKECEDVLCTEIFVTTNIHVIDSTTKHTVILSDYYTVNTEKGDTFRADVNEWIDSSYVVLSDNYLSNLRNKEYKFRFMGFKDGSLIVNEPLTIKADCCHIQKVSGKDTVLIR